MPAVIPARSSWQRLSLLLVVAVLTVATFATVVHRHIGADDQGCVLCHVRHDPGIDTSPARVVATPEVSERLFLTVEFTLASQDSDPLHPGRAPPSSL